MKLLLSILGLVFCLFPYTQIIRLESYTQPYALIFCALSVLVSAPLLLRDFPRKDAALLGGLAALGVIGFLISCTPHPSAQEFKYLLVYVSPFIFALSAYAFVVDHPVMADRLLVGGALAWIGVGVIQTVISPSFATNLVGTFGDAADVVVGSGRGTLGLAPEPTHFGFHMLVLAAALSLVGGRNALSMVCFGSAILIARSSSAMLAIALGGLTYLAFHTSRARLLLLAALPAYAMIGLVLDSKILPEGLRAVSLLKDFYADPFYLITSDASTNARLGGIYVGAKQILANAFLPAGLSHQAWTSLTGQLMARNSWLLFLSDSGIPSGILLVVYQTGIASLVLLVLILKRMMTGLYSQYETMLMSVLLFVFLSQYMISTPGFGMIYGMILARHRFFASARPAGPQTMDALPQPDWPPGPHGPHGVLRPLQMTGSSQ